MLRSRHAREKCLAPSNASAGGAAGAGAGGMGGGEAVFERNLGGKAEDWEVRWILAYPLNSTLCVVPWLHGPWDV